MKIVRDDLPTEGVHISGKLFLPGRPEEVDDALARELIERKGFKKAFNKDERRAER